MLIQGKCIHKLACHLPTSAIGSTLIIGVRDIQRFREKLERAGFTDLTEGESVLPSISFGAKSRFNADGKDEPQRNLPKEEVCWMREWHWKEWRGKNETEEVSDFRDQCRERYQRKHIVAPCVYLTIVTNPNSEKLVVSPACIYNPDSPSLLLHTINLFLEIFGECEIFQENLEAIVNVPIRRKNWRILPPGIYPWSRIYQELEQIVVQAPRSNQNLIWDRLQHISLQKPDFLAIGQCGFKGYFVLGFLEKQFFILESLVCNNATYILGEDWENLSKLTKAEILNENLHQARIIHRRGWHQRINELFG